MSHDRVGREGHGMGYMGIWMGVDTPGEYLGLRCGLLNGTGSWRDMGCGEGSRASRTLK